MVEIAREEIQHTLHCRSFVQGVRVGIERDSRKGERRAQAFAANGTGNGVFRTWTEGDALQALISICLNLRGSCDRCKCSPVAELVHLLRELMVRSGTVLIDYGICYLLGPCNVLSMDCLANKRGTTLDTNTVDVGLDVFVVQGPVVRLIARHVPALGAMCLSSISVQVCVVLLIQVVQALEVQLRKRCFRCCMHKAHQRVVHEDGRALVLFSFVICVLAQMVHHVVA
mmetsp:Transcript_4144/g.7627  ORF Transcript_4144/g.7627 Transcript_4144/m.7627 type:complete len:228 (+) Transcript_4144:737-1420(+)